LDGYGVTSPRDGTVKERRGRCGGLGGAREEEESLEFVLG
jgi:hypothetical protein